MPEHAKYIVLQYLLHGGAALAGFVLSAFLLADPAPLIAVKTIFAPAYLLASKGLDAHFQGKDGAQPPLWQVLEYSFAQGMMVASFVVILGLDLNQTGSFLLGQFTMIAMGYGVIVGLLSIRERRRIS